jgi:hypothetical protein
MSLGAARLIAFCIRPLGMCLMRYYPRGRARRRFFSAMLMIPLLCTGLLPAQATAIARPDTLAQHFSVPAVGLVHVTEDIAKMPIPAGAKRQITAALVGGKARPLQTGSDPCDTAGVDGSLTGNPTVLSGQTCVYTLSPSGCSWSITAQSPGVSYDISGNTLVVTAPPDLTQTEQSYVLDGSGGGLACLGSEFAISGTILPQPEKNCGRCGGTEFGHPVDIADGSVFEWGDRFGVPNPLVLVPAVVGLFLAFCASSSTPAQMD